jgi:hypothetical protein
MFLFGEPASTSPEHALARAAEENGGAAAPPS